MNIQKPQLPIFLEIGSRPLKKANVNRQKWIKVDNKKRQAIKAHLLHLMLLLQIQHLLLQIQHLLRLKILDKVNIQRHIQGIEMLLLIK